MRIFYVSPNLPSAPTSGGAQRTRLLLHALRALGQVDTIFLPARLPLRGTSAQLAEDHPPPLATESTDAIQQQTAGHHPFRFLGRDLLTFHQAGRHRWQPFPPLVSKIGDLSPYDFVVSRYLSSACILDLFRHPRVLIDVDDYDPDRLRQRLNHASWLKRLTLRRCLSFSEVAHHTYLPKAAHCWISSPADRSHHGLSNATLLPNIPYFPAGLPSPIPPASSILPPAFLIVGTLSYSANSDGIDAFLHEAWPTLRHQAPTAELHIVGQGLSPAQRARWSRFPGVTPIGFVESLEASYARCTATIAPILAGGGTNIKILESAAYGRPCVVSRIAHRGFEQTLPDGQACLRVEDLRDMSAACLRLIREPRLAAQIGLTARQSIETHYTPEIFAAAVREGCARVMQSSK